MYTIIGPPNGPFTFRTHVTVSDLQPEDASHILAALGPLLDRLRQKAAEGRPPYAEAREVPAARVAAES